MATDVSGGALVDAVATGLKSMENLVNLTSQRENVNRTNFSDLIDTLRKTVNSVSTRTGHAKFRRRPSVQPPPVQTPEFPSTDLTLGSPTTELLGPTKIKGLDAARLTYASLSAITLGSPTAELLGPTKIKGFDASRLTYASLSAITGDKSVNNGLNMSNSTLAVVANKPEHGDKSVNNVFNIPNIAANKPKHGVGKPPLAVKKCLKPEHSGKKTCHCMKRKNRIKKTIKVRATGPNVTDVPSDEYSWRKYGQKPVKGTPHPRGYYRCSIGKECKAKKLVERDSADPTMMIVSYIDDHTHNLNLREEILTLRL